MAYERERLNRMCTEEEIIVKKSNLIITIIGMIAMLAIIGALGWQNYQQQQQINNLNNSNVRATTLS